MVFGRGRAEAGSPLLSWPLATSLRSSLIVISQRPTVTTLFPGSNFLLPPFSRASPSTKVPANELPFSDITPSWYIQRSALQPEQPQCKLQESIP